MPVTTPPALSAIPAFPALSERAAGTYNANAYACLNHWAATGGPQLAALAANVFANAADAAGSATAAIGSATTAGDHSVTAGTHATNAGASAVQAAASAVTAAQRLADMEALYDLFDDRYLGVKSADPTQDNDGNPLQAGAIYVNSVTGYLRAYNGTDWVQGISAVAGVTSVNGLTGAVTVPNPSARIFFATGA